MSFTTKFEVGRILRMAMAQQLHVPPSAFFGHIFGAVVGHVVSIVHRLNPSPPVQIKPGLPDFAPRLAFAVTPQRMGMKTVPPWILPTEGALFTTHYTRLARMIPSIDRAPEWQFFTSRDQE